MRHGGTHLINPIVRKLTGRTVYSPKGEAALICQPSPITIVFLRDPRNWLVSFFKWKRGRAEAIAHDCQLAAFMLEHRKDDSPLGYALKWSSRWVGWPGALVARFEDMLPAERGLVVTEEIRQFLQDRGSPVPHTAEEAYRYSYGQSGTYTGKPSNWREWFGPLSVAAWEANGGAELVKKMGYAP